MACSVQVEEIFQHFGKALVKLEDVVRLQISTKSVLTLIDYRFGLPGESLLNYFVRPFPCDFGRGERVQKQLPGFKDRDGLAVCEGGCFG
jgi:hypothetical protein